MAAELFNLDQVKIEVEKAIADYRVALQDENISKRGLISMVESLLADRQLLIDEIDEIKEIQEGWIPIMFRRKHNLKLVIEELDESTYNDLSYLAYKLDLPPGDVLSFLMKAVLENLDDTFPELSSKMLESLQERKLLRITINRQEILSVTQEDLVEMNAKVSFSKIDTLQFVNIDLETFKTYIDKISYCGLVQVPSNLSKLLVYAKCHNCDLIEFYEGRTPPDRSKVYHNKESWDFREARQLARGVRQARREARCAMKEAKRALELTRHSQREFLTPATDLDLDTYDITIPSQKSPFGLQNSLEISRKAYDQAYMAEMATYLQDVQEYVRRMQN